MGKLKTDKFSGEKYADVSVYFEDALYITADLEDFDGDVQKWKTAFYELWRYQMTWHFAHRIYVEDTSDGVYVGIYCKPAYRGSLLDTMETLGYRNIQVIDYEIGTIECTELPDEKFIDYAIVTY